MEIVENLLLSFVLKKHRNNVLLYYIYSQIFKMTLKVILADIIVDEVDEQEMSLRMEELERLVSTYQWFVVVRKIQKRAYPDYNTYIWKWKLQEIKDEMEREWADLLIIGNILKPDQIYNINEFIAPWKVKARDRVDLILKIFEAHAKNTEAKLQIELASIKHMWPRIFGMWMELSRQWWWSKLARWLWETNSEIMKRHLQDKELKIRKKLEIYKKSRALHRDYRKKRNFQTVGIVWYTNAWKSSLLNALTTKKVLAEDKLFATLGTSVGKMFVFTDELGNWKEILLSDTIWFIRDLPPNLIEAFSSTLEDSIESDLLLVVVDANDLNIKDKIKVVNEILDKIWAKQKRIYVFNKIDKVSDLQLQALKKEFRSFNPIFVSANEKTWLNELKQIILKSLY